MAVRPPRWGWRPMKEAPRGALARPPHAEGARSRSREPAPWSPALRHQPRPPASGTVPRAPRSALSFGAKRAGPGRLHSSCSGKSSHTFQKALECSPCDSHADPALGLRECRAELEPLPLGVCVLETHTAPAPQSPRPGLLACPHQLWRPQQAAPQTPPSQLAVEHKAGCDITPPGGPQWRALPTWVRSGVSWGMPASPVRPHACQPPLRETQGAGGLSPTPHSHRDPTPTRPT